MAIEEAHGEPGATPSWEMAEHMSETKARGGVRIAPNMSSYIVKKQSVRNEAAKERRKADENRRLAPKRPNGKGKGEEAAGEGG